MVMAMERRAVPRATSDLARQMAEIRWFLRATLDRDEAEAMVSPGYRCGCAHEGCPRCNGDPVEVGQSSRRGRTQSDPRYVKEIIGRVCLFPPHLMVGVPRELRRLPTDERLVLVLLYGCGLRVEAVAERLKVSTKTVMRQRDRGLETIAEALWDERGGVRFSA